MKSLLDFQSEKEVDIKEEEVVEEIHKMREEKKERVEIIDSPEEVSKEVPLPDKKYKIIYADPPWAYRDKREKHPRLSGGASVHYNTMELGDIKQLPIRDITDDNCILFLWATFPNLPMAFEVINSWGFTYKTLGFSWIKLNKNNGKPFFGIGYYTKSNCEVCLIAVKGKPKINSNFVSSVVMEPREEHSKKPDVIRNKIVELMGDIPRIELFARRSSEGWDSWGNEL